MPKHKEEGTVKKEMEGRVAVVTGGAQGIGKCICETFEKNGAKVCMIDTQENDYFQGDIGKKEVLEAFARLPLPMPSDRSTYRTPSSVLK